jgi:LuxR family transcriptional regulator, maltose regulon positive regulatory protein
MSTPILATKLYVPPPRTKIVLRPRLIERLNEGLQRKMILISASAGFGKTTLVSEWVADCKRLEPKVRVAWLSLDEGDNDPARFLTYLVAALQTIAQCQVEGVATKLGEGVLGELHASQPQPPPIESILTALINEITTLPDNFIFVLDDYHIIDSTPVDNAITFLLEHLPPQMHLVIITREDPQFPLARLRARSQLTELRAADLRFTPSEATEFLNQMMGLKLSAEDISALETRTEGWIAGLQLAAISMQGHKDAASFIKSFTGSHHFVLDYLVEEVLQQQPEGVQTFLLRTSILDRMCGPLCEAVLHTPPGSGQETLEYLERANLFIVPLDNQRCWYRYHHLFAELLQQRLHQSASSGNEAGGITEYHIHASVWYEDNDLEIEAFQHAVAANDIERAERLIDGKGLYLPFRGVADMLDWLESLPTTVLDAKPSLWVRSALSSLFAGQTTGVEEKLQAAEDSLRSVEAGDETRNLIGQIASARAILALTQYQIETILAQSRRALEYLHPRNLSSRATANWTLGFAYLLQGDRTAARQSYMESIRLGQVCGNIFTTSLATNDLGYVQEIENQLPQAAKTYQHALQLFGDPPRPHAWQTFLGLARISYEWNDLDAAEQQGQQSLQLAQQYEGTIDRFISSEVFLARLKLARGDVGGAATMLALTEQSARQKNFIRRLPEIAAIQVLTLIRQGQVATAAQLARQYELPLSQARVLIAQDDPSAALALLEPLRRQMEEKGWQDERLKVMILQAVALYAHNETDKAKQVLSEALTLAEPGGFIRLFVDEGEPMRLLIADYRLSIIEHHLVTYAGKLLAAFGASQILQPKSETLAPPARAGVENRKPKILVEPLSERELEVLQLIAQGLSNREISERLFLALSTVKGHNQKIFDKLQVVSRTEAITRARELGLL